MGHHPILSFSNERISGSVAAEKLHRERWTDNLATKIPSSFTTRLLLFLGFSHTLRPPTTTAAVLGRGYEAEHQMRLPESKHSAAAHLGGTSVSLRYLPLHSLCALWTLVGNT